MIYLNNICVDGVLDEDCLSHFTVSLVDKADPRRTCFIKDELTQKQIEELEVIISSRISTMILENKRG